jgi:septum site-determining protein MinC
MNLVGIKKIFEEDIEESKTKFHKGSLRSGRKIEFDGSLVIMGDVNAGAEIIATGNIAVCGILRGLAHAGSNGNTKAVIYSPNVLAPQLRIANKILELDYNADENIDIRTYAYIDESEKIVLE